MNPYGTLIIVVIVGLLTAIVSFFAWMKGTKSPSKSVRDKIALDSIRNQLAKWHLCRTWKCVDVNEKYPGFMGMPMRVVILESNGERIRFGCGNKEITIGTEVRLRLRTDDELRQGVWVSVTDEFLTLK